MNKILLVGRTVSEIRYNQTSNGISYSRGTLAVERRNSGNSEITDYIPFVAWRGTAEFLNRNVRKGTLISIEGFLASNSYENREGNLIRSYEVSIENVSILEPKSVVQNRTPNPGAMNFPNEQVNNSFRQNSKPVGMGMPEFGVPANDKPVQRPTQSQVKNNNFVSPDELFGNTNEEDDSNDKDLDSNYFLDLDNIDKLD